MLKILITNIQLTIPGGTVSYTKDLAKFLIAKGFIVEVFTYSIGTVGREMIAEGIPVVTRLSQLINKPDIIHAHHTPTAFEALHYFKNTPAIFVVHDRTSRFDSPLPHKHILTYAAVDNNCLDRLLVDFKINQTYTKVFYNWVDTMRFPIRTSFNEMSMRAVVFSNYATPDNHYKIIAEACSQINLPLNVIGSGMDNSVSNPEKELYKYDIVFAKAKAAIEALATGAAVILCDFGGVGGMVQTNSIEHLRNYNFGRKTLTHEFNTDFLIDEIKKYNIENNRINAAWIQEHASLEKIAATIIDFYYTTIGDFNLDKKGQLEESWKTRVHCYYLKAYFLFTKTALFKKLSAFKYFIKNRRFKIKFHFFL